MLLTRTLSYFFIILLIAPGNYFSNWGGRYSTPRSQNSSKKESNLPDRYTKQNKKIEDKRDRARPELIEKLKQQQGSGFRRLADKLKDYQTKTSQHFILFYIPRKDRNDKRKDEKKIDEILKKLETVITACLQRFKCSPPTVPIKVILLEKHEDLEKLLGQRTNDPSFFKDDINTIFLSREKLLEENFPHEVCHAVIEQFYEKKKEKERKKQLLNPNYKPNFPKHHYTLEEGLSELEEGEKNRQLVIIKTLYSHYLRDGFKFNPLQFLLISAPLDPTDPRTSIFYSQATSFVSFLLDKGYSCEDILELGLLFTSSLTERQKEVALRADLILKSKLHYDKLLQEWLKWQEEQFRKMDEVEWQRFKQAGYDEIERRRKYETKRPKREVEAEIKAVLETLKKMEELRKKKK